MKIKLAIIIGCLGVLFSNYAIAYGCNRSNCGKSYYSSEQRSSGCPRGDSCQCVDPACLEGNSCMSISKCCQAFGNIGR